MAGLGAWSFGWYHRDMDAAIDRLRAGILAFKAELVYNGFTTKGFLPDAPIFGRQMEELTQEAQAVFGIADDGVIGPITALHIFRKRCADLEATYEIPMQLLTRLKSLESNNDPVAQGYVDSEDEGIVELHMPYWPTLTVAEAWTPSFALPLAARKIDALESYTGAYEAAIVGWNIGQEYARRWRVAGYPTIGGPIMGTDDHGRPIYAFERATNYWTLIQRAAT